MNTQRSRPGNESGVALVAALLTLMGLTTLVIAAALSSMLEKNVTVSHRLSGEALYAADSGTEVARQYITTFAQHKLDSLTGVWSGNGLIIPDPARLFPPGAIALDHGTEPVYATETTMTFLDSTLDVQSQSYLYAFTTVSTGSNGAAERVVTSEGRLRVSATRGSFTDFLMFTDRHVVPGGSPIWFHTSGHFDGRIHTNDQYRFAYYPTFEDQVTSVHQKAWYYNNGAPRERDDDHYRDIDVPNFYGGFDRAEPEIQLPENSYSQQRAALGGNAANTHPVTNSEIRSHLGLAAGSSPPPTGVYVPNRGGAVTGGVYVQGTARFMELTVENGNQIYRVKDANNLITRIIIDPSAGTTTIEPSAGSATTLTGTPRGVMYTEGKIKSLRGPERSHGRVVPAVAADHALSVVASDDIVIQRDIAYEDYGSESVLGIFSSGGNVRIGSSAPDEVMVDAFIMASADRKVFTVDNYSTGSYRGQVHLRGGMVTNHYGAFGTFGRNGMTGFGRDFRYDRRGHMPPFYPLTLRFTANRPEPRILAWRLGRDR